MADRTIERIKTAQAAGLRAALVRRALHVEMAREPMRFPRIAHA